MDGNNDQNPQGGIMPDPNMGQQVPTMGDQPAMPAAPMADQPVPTQVPQDPGMGGGMGIPQTPPADPGTGMPAADPTPAPMGGGMEMPPAAPTETPATGGTDPSGNPGTGAPTM